MSKLLFCPNCGNAYEESDRFCQHCGMKRPPDPAEFQKSAPVFAADDMCGGQAFLEEPVFSESAGRMSQQEVQALINQCHGLLAQGKKEQVQQMLENVRQKADWNADYLCLLGRLYRQNGKTAAALAVYNDCIAKHPQYPLAYINSVLAHCDMGNYKEGERMAVYGIMRFPKNRNQEEQANYAVAYANYAYAVGCQGRKEDAKRLIDEAARNGYTKCAHLRQVLGIN